MGLSSDSSDSPYSPSVSEEVVKASSGSQSDEDLGGEEVADSDDFDGSDESGSGSEAEEVDDSDEEEVSSDGIDQPRIEISEKDSKWDRVIKLMLMLNNCSLDDDMVTDGTSETTKEAYSIVSAINESLQKMLEPRLGPKHPFVVLVQMFLELNVCDLKMYQRNADKKSTDRPTTCFFTDTTITKVRDGVYFKLFAKQSSPPVGGFNADAETTPSCVVVAEVAVLKQFKEIVLSLHILSCMHWIVDLFEERRKNLGLPDPLVAVNTFQMKFPKPLGTKKDSVTIPALLKCMYTNSVTLMDAILADTPDGRRIRSVITATEKK